MQDLTQAIEIDPHDTTALFLRGLAYWRLSQLEQASQDFEHAIAADDEDGCGHLGRAMCRARSARHRDTALEPLCRSQELFTQELSDDSEDPWPLLYRAQTRRYLALLGTLPQPIIERLGGSATRISLLKHALSDLEQALVLRPEFVEALAEQSIVRALLGQVEPAVLHLDTVTTAVPERTSRTAYHRTDVAHSLILSLIGRAERDAVIEELLVVREIVTPGDENARAISTVLYKLCNPRR